MTPHALFLAQNKLHADLKILVVVIIEFDVVRTRTGSVEEAEIDKPGILIGTAETTDSKDSLNQLSTHDGIKVQARAQIEDVNRESTTLEGLLDPVDEVAVEVLIGNDLHVRNVLRGSLRQRQTVVRISRTRTSAKPATSVVWRRTVAVAFITVSVASRRRRWRAVWPVPVSVTIATVSAVPSISAISAAVTRTSAWVAIIPTSVIVWRTRASTCIYRTLVWACVLLWVSVALRLANFKVCVQ